MTKDYPWNKGPSLLLQTNSEGKMSSKLEERQRTHIDLSMSSETLIDATCQKQFIEQVCQGRAKSVKRFERSNGLDTALYKNYLYFFIYNRYHNV